MAASGATTPERDARRGVQCLTRQHDSALGADRGRRRRADVCDSSASALAPAIVGIRGWVTGGEPHTCAMPKPACALGMQAQADGALITPAGRAVPRPMCATLLRDTPKGSQAAPRVRFRQPGCTQSAIRPARPWQFPRQGQAGFSGCRASSSPRSCSWRCYSSQGGATARCRWGPTTSSPSCIHGAARINFLQPHNPRARAGCGGVQARVPRFRADAVA